MSKFIGRRIVPKHDGVWDINKEYEELSIVLDKASGESYISRMPVPVGTAISDETYWMQYSLYSAQIAEAVKEMEATETRLTQYVDTAESNMNNRVNAAESLTNGNKAELNSRMDTLNKRLDANVSASTDKNQNYAAEVVDARVDAHGHDYASLGAALRRSDGALRPDLKVEIGLGKVTLKGESDNESTGQVEKIVVEDRCVAADVRLTYVYCNKNGSNFIRGFFTIPLAIFQERCAGHLLTTQIYSSVECDVLMGWGFLTSYKRNYTLQQVLHLKRGYNELRFDCASEEFKALKIESDCKYFYLHYLFGVYDDCKVQPPTGEAVFRFSLYDATTLGAALVGYDAVPVSSFSGYSHDGYHSQEAVHAKNSDQAEQAGRAEYSENAGVVKAIQKMGYASKIKTVSVTLSTSSVLMTINKDTPKAGDAGFSVNLGKLNALKGKDVVVYRDEAFPLKRMALNGGHSWGGGTYVDVQMLFKPLRDKWFVAAFDELYEWLLQSGLVKSEYEDDFWLMFYRNDSWDLSGLTETAHNHYRVFLGDPENVVYSRICTELKSTVDALDGKYSSMAEQLDTLESDLADMNRMVEVLKASNPLWGKKWVACGDSFTEGDFNGAADSDWKDADGKKKVYPYFIGKRNNMTVINEAKCGTIMALDKSYVADPTKVSITTRNPFSLNRYKAIPKDADYITLWFGINDSGHTNLGELSDTTNLTFYGAWNVVLEYLIKNYPFAKIGIIITDRGSEKYRQATRDVAVKWGIPYLDMMGDDKVPVMMYRENNLGLCKTAGDLRNKAFIVSDTNSHPNWRAHEYQSTFIENFMRSL